MTYSSLSKRFPKHSYFCGWYFRCQSNKQTLAIIPSVHKTKDSAFCTIQVITDSISEQIRCSPLVADAPPNKKTHPFGVRFLFGRVYDGESNQSNAIARWAIARCGLDRIHTIISSIPLGSEERSSCRIPEKECSPTLFYFSIS